MKIRVVAKTNAKQNKIEKIDSSSYKIQITAAPEKGKANTKIIELLAKHLGIPKTSAKIVRGQKSNIKLVEIDL